MMSGDNKIRMIVQGGFGPLILLVAVVLAACEQPTDGAVVQDALTEMDADAVMFGMRDFLTTNGVRSGTVKADTAYVYDDSAVVKMWGVDMTLYHENGRERARVTAERGTLHRRSEKMVAEGNVVLVAEDGARRVESEELHYDPNAQQIWSDSNATHTYRGRATRGTCFRSDLDFTNFTVCDIRGSADVGTGGGGGR